MNDIAWATGLFEGEGSININPSRQWCASLQLAMSDKDILDRFQSIFGGYIYDKKKQQPHHKKMWTWQVASAADVKKVLLQMLPLLGHRRAYKALNTLDLLDKI